MVYIDILAKFYSLYILEVSLQFVWLKHNKKYQNYKNAYLNRIDDDISTIDNYSNYSDNNLLTLQEYHQNSRDLSATHLMEAP